MSNKAGVPEKKISMTGLYIVRMLQNQRTDIYMKWLFIVLRYLRETSSIGIMRLVILERLGI